MTYTPLVMLCQTSGPHSASLALPPPALALPCVPSTRLSRVLLTASHLFCSRPVASCLPSFLNLRVNAGDRTSDYVTLLLKDLHWFPVVSRSCRLFTGHPVSFCMLSSPCLPQPPSSPSASQNEHWTAQASRPLHTWVFLLGALSCPFLLRKVSSVLETQLRCHPLWKSLPISFPLAGQVPHCSFPVPTVPLLPLTVDMSTPAHL